MLYCSVKDDQLSYILVAPELQFYQYLWGPLPNLDTCRRYDHEISHVNHMISVARVMVSNMVHNGYFKTITGRYVVMVIY